VGERGPEVFVPRQPGTVLPAQAPQAHSNPDVYEGMDPSPEFVWPGAPVPQHFPAYDPRGANRIHGDAFNAWLQGLPESWENIEDRRNEELPPEEMERLKKLGKLVTPSEYWEATHPEKKGKK